MFLFFSSRIFIYSDSSRSPREANLTLEDSVAINNQFTLNIRK